jgi:cephalosporin hydroxylase
MAANLPVAALVSVAFLAILCYGAYLCRHRLLGILRKPVSTLFHYFYYYNGTTTWGSTEWMGIELLKSPFDLWTYQNILHETRPDLLVETGTNRGGSALYFAHLFDLLGKGRVVSVDIAHPPEGLPQHPRIEYIVSSSTEPGVIARIKSGISPGDKVMVSLDSDHAEAHVSRELELYSQLVVCPGDTYSAIEASL